jgi:hypothetical protein
VRLRKVISRKRGAPKEFIPCKRGAPKECDST